MRTRSRLAILALLLQAGWQAGWTLAAAQPVAPADAIITYRGACEPSAAVLLPAPGGQRLLVVANDGDNLLRAYDPLRGGQPRTVAPLDDFLAIPADDRGRGRGRADIEAAAMVGDRIYWIGSHSRASDGDARPNRHRFFATRAELAAGPGDAPTLPTIGASRGLTAALAALHSRLRDALALNPDGTLRREAPEAASEAGGLNIEGLARGPDEGELLIGLRGPLLNDRAVVIRFRNPAAVVDVNAAPQIEHLTLPLRNLGIRSIERAERAPPDRRYLIVAGSPGSADAFRLFRWAGPGGPDPAEIVEAHDLLRGLTDAFAPGTGRPFRFGPEAMTVDPEGTTIHLLSDDGDRVVDAEGCQEDATPPARRSFRGVVVDLGPPPTLRRAPQP